MVITYNFLLKTLKVHFNGLKSRDMSLGFSKCFGTLFTCTN
uniref:Uncharacterized protein n=1 Tax=Arundo donax TaxID=35708 RepID=A0A0A9CDB6_ARUDO